MPPASPDSAEPQEYILQREGDRDLAFSGWLVGYAEKTSDWQGWTIQRDDREMGHPRQGVSVAIYATSTNVLVIHVCRFTEYELGDERDQECSIGVFPFEEDFGFKVLDEDPLEWLKRDAGGKLGSTSKEAWLQAGRRWRART